MCCLFGILDYGHSLSVRRKNKVLSVLASACEARGTDATGIAYNSGGKLRIYKRPVPAHRMRFKVPADAAYIMGHTRMATQGNEHQNFNNHPFPGTTKDGAFALAHNGVLYNDKYLRRSLLLPGTRIETDSYIGVQLIEQKKTLDFASLRYMAEQVEGSFAFSVLDGKDSLYLIKGDNPLCLVHFPALGLYLYASTEEILNRALRKARLPEETARRVPVDCGEILKIDRAGAITRGEFDPSGLFLWNPLSPYSWCDWQHPQLPQAAAPDDYLDEIKSVAPAFGYTPEAIDRLAAMGFSAEELEEFLYCGEV